MSSLIEAANHLAEYWWPWAAHAGWQAAIVALLALAAVRWGERLPSVVRYGILLVALFKFAIPPLAAVPGGVFSLVSLESEPVVEASQTETSEEQPSAPEIIPHEEPRPEQLDTTPVSLEPREPVSQGGSVKAEAAAPPVEPQKSSTALRAPENRGSIEINQPNIYSTVVRPSWKSVLMGLHLVGGVAILLWMLIQIGWLRRLKRNQSRVIDGELWNQFVRTAHELRIRRIPALWLSRDETVPYSHGVLWPVVVLPQALVESLSEEELNAVMAHELAHHRQGDFWLLWLQTALLAVWWFHPLMWMLSRSLRRVREDCCDDAVLHAGITSEQAYCDTLLAVAARTCTRPTPAIALSAVQGHSLENRFRRIMDQTLKRRDRLNWGHRLVPLLLALVLLPGLNQAAETETNDVTDDNKTSAGQLLGTITGTVVSETGAPVAGAEVLVFWDFPGRGLSPMQLLQRGKTNVDGTFSLPVLKSSQSNGSFHRSDTIRVWVPHGTEGWTILNSDGALPESPLKLTLNNPEPLALTFRNQAGQPASGIEVSPLYVKLSRHRSQVPSQLRDRFTVTTDDQGSVSLAGMSSGNLSSLEVSGESIGRQWVYWSSSFEAAEEITLRDAVPISGKLTGKLPEGRSFDELTVRLKTKPAKANHSPIGLAELRVNQDGTFATDALATGKLEIEVDFPDDFPAYAQSPQGILVSSESNQSLTIPIKPAVHVTRQLIDAETQEPVPGVRIYLHARKQRWFRTDENGVFSAYLAPDPDYTISYAPPRPYISPRAWLEDRLAVPRGTAQLELSPLKLLRGVTLPGLVVDENEKPVKDIKVTATWSDSQRSRQQVQAVSGEDGKFLLTDVHPTAKLEFQTYQESISIGDHPVVTATEADDPLKFVVPAVEHLSIAGKVIDRQGNPVASATYKVVVAVDAGPNMGYLDEPHTGQTDAEGRFRTPVKLHPLGSYQVIVVDGDDEVGDSEWSRGKNKTHNFDVVVNRVPTTSPPDTSPAFREPSRVPLSVIVTNRDDQPVSGATVIVWTLGEPFRLRTDGAGRFHLNEVYKQGAWVFVDSERYRFYGEFTKPAGLEHQIRLTRVDEPSGEPLQTITDHVSQNVMDRAQTELLKFTESLLKTDQESQKWDLLSLLPLLDPSTGLAYINDPRYDVTKIGGGNLTKEWHQNRVRFYASQQFVNHDIPRAIATARQLTPGEFQVLALCRLTEKIPESNRDHREELWQAATDTAHNIENPSERLAALTMVGDSLLKQREITRGTSLLKEAVQLANIAYQDQLKKGEIERDQYYRAHLAWVLAPVDLETALKIVPEDIEKDFDVCRYYGNIAHQIADMKPAEAERILEKLAPYSRRDRWMVRVCYRMAKTDYERARRLSETIASSNLRPYTWGVMAHAVHPQAPQLAKELLAEAFAALQESVDTGQDGGREIFSPLTTAVSLLPIAEQVDPERSREYFWRALSFRTKITSGNLMTGLNDIGNDAVLGSFIARYDREVASLLIRTDYGSLSPNVEEWPYFLFGGLTVIDPAAAVELVSQLPEQTEEDRKLKVNAWKEIVPMLIHRGEESWAWLQDRQYNHWKIDELDL